jgi:2-phospho-L-lactate guanylyltransferase
VNELHRPVVAVVPVRAGETAKSRLAEELAPADRVSLVTAMLADVTAALAASPVDRVVVSSGGQEAAATATALGVDVLLDPPRTDGLDAALQAARARLGEAGTLVVVMADLPRLHPRDVERLLDTDAPVVIAATADGGTGALLRRPPGVMGTAYGEGSAGRHARLAHRAGVQPSTVDLPGFRHDVDTLEDLRVLAEGPVGRFTAAWLEQAAGRIDALAVRSAG